MSLPNADKLRARLREQFSEMLGADPVCCGRVCTGTLDWLADEAVRACEAVYRHHTKATTPEIEGEDRG